MRALFVSGFALCLTTGGAWALETFSLDSITVELRDGKMTIPRVDFVDTNISRDEAAMLFSSGGQRNSQAAVLSKLEASRIAIPELRMESKAGGVVVRNLEASGLRQGRFALFKSDGVDGAFSVDDAPGGSIRVGALRVEDGEYGRLLEALESSGARGAVWRAAKIEFAGFDLRVPDKDLPAGIGGDRLYHVQLESVNAQTSYQGDVPLKSAFAMRNLSVTPPRGSAMQRDLEEFGYTSLRFGASASGLYDPAKKTYLLDDFTLTGADAGVLSFSGSFAAVEPEALMRPGPQRLDRILRSEVARFMVRFVNQGVVEKAIAYYGKKQSRTPEQVTREFAALVTGMAPMMLGGDPASLKLAEAVADFVRVPKSLQIILTARGAPVKLGEVSRMGQPNALTQKFEVEALANR